MEENIIKRIGNKKLSEITVSEFCEVLAEYDLTQREALPNVLCPYIVDALIEKGSERIVNVHKLVYDYFNDPKNFADRKHLAQIKEALTEYAADQLPAYNLHKNNSLCAIDLNNISKRKISLIDGIGNKRLSIIERMAQSHGFQLQP